MSSVIICDVCITYVEESRRRGFEPILIVPAGVSEGLGRFKRYSGDIRIIDMGDVRDYDDLLKKVEATDPICIVVGEDEMTNVAERLAKDLGLKHNDPATSDKRCNKYQMQMALKKAGLRYIRTAKVSNAKEAEEFWRRQKLEKAMVKYANGAGTIGNKVCNSVKEAADHIKKLLKGKNAFGLKDSVVIQEFIEGTEYVVDTVSYEGKHMVTDVWEYGKVLTGDGSVLYDETRLIVHPGPGIPELIQYAFKVLDATGFEYGPCHGEYKIDDKGPVLIETNPRPMGGSMTSEFYDEISDSHTTDLAIDSYIAPEVFFSRMSVPYRPKKYSIWKDMISEKECDISLAMLRAVLEHMESFRYTAHDITGKKKHVFKTKDLNTSPALLKFVNADYRRMREDADLITELELRYFGLLEHGDEKVKASKVRTDIHELSAPFVQNRKTLVVTDKGEYVTRNGNKIKDVKDAEAFGAAIYADASSCVIHERFESIIITAERMREDGVIVVAPEVYDNLPYGRSTVELALKVAGCDLEVRAGNDVPVVGRKERRYQT